MLRRIQRRIARTFSEPAADMPADLVYAPPLDLPRIAPDEMWTCDAPLAAAVAPPGTPRPIVRPKILFHDDPGGVGLLPDAGPYTFTLPPSFVVAARRVFQVGFRSYVTRDGRLFTDESHAPGAEQERFAAALLSGDPFRNEYTGLTAGGRPGAFRIDPKAQRVEKLDGGVVSLVSLEGPNYGSFLFRVVPKLIGREAWPDDWRVLVPWLGRTMIDLLGMLGIAEERLVLQRRDVVYDIERAAIPSFRTAHAMLDAEAVALFDEIAARYADPSAGERLFVSRRGWNPEGSGARVMLNEAEIAEALEAEGFETILPHEMSMADQIRRFASARIVVGAAGSAMFNTVFCRPGTIVVDIESEPHWIAAHMNLFGSRGLAYGVFEGETMNRDWDTPHKPFWVDAKALVARVRSL